MRTIAVISTIWISIILCGCDSLFNDVSKIKDLTPMIKVKGGTFSMGFAGIAEEVHSVTLDDYYISPTEVTYKQWLEVYTWAVAHGYVFKELGDPDPGRQGGNTVDDMSPVGNDQHPVTKITWQNAVAWCNALSEMKGRTPVYYTYTDGSKLEIELFKDSTVFSNYIENDIVEWNDDGYRLPTEAEWEYAARKTKTGYSDGDHYSGYDGTTNEPGEYAWYTINSDNSTHEVARKSPNRLGLYDMSGNVEEYCWDYDDDYAYSSGSLINPRGINVRGDSCMIRGGSWMYTEDDMDTAYRYSRTEHYIDNSIGFRVARTAK